MNFLKDKIIKKRTLRGMWSLIPNNLVTEVLSISGLDFIILDMEHGNFSKIDIENSIVVCELNGCSPLVRVPLMEKGNIQSALDSGCHGLVFPKISTKFEAAEAISLCEFSPIGERGFNPFTRFNKYNLKVNNFNKSKKPILRILIIETRQGVENLDEILSVKGIDVIYLGIYDLLKEYNGKDINDGFLTKIIISCLEKIKKSGKISGLMVNNKKMLRISKKFKVQFLAISVDTELLGKAANTMISKIK